LTEWGSLDLEASLKMTVKEVLGLFEMPCPSYWDQDHVLFAVLCG